MELQPCHGSGSARQRRRRQPAREPGHRSRHPGREPQPGHSERDRGGVQQQLQRRGVDGPVRHRRRRRRAEDPEPAEQRHARDRGSGWASMPASATGFDIDSTGAAYAALFALGTARLYTINLGSGGSSPIGVTGPEAARRPHGDFAGRGPRARGHAVARGDGEGAERRRSRCAGRAAASWRR